MNDAGEGRDLRIERLRGEWGLPADLPASLLDQALTHSSYSNERGVGIDNERMEFLGDAILGAVAAEILYTKNPGLDEGGLSKRKGQLVSRAMLGERAGELGLGPLMLLGTGEVKTGGGRRRSILGCALEALAGAIYLHAGYDFTRDWLERHVLGPLLDRCEGDRQKGDYKSALQELTQEKFSCLPGYSLEGETGPEHDRTFIVKVSVGDRVIAIGQGARKKYAENAAARAALEALAADSSTG